MAEEQEQNKINTARFITPTHLLQAVDDKQKKLPFQKEKYILTE